MKRNTPCYPMFLAALVCCVLSGPAAWAAATTPEQAQAVVTGWLKADAAPLGMALGQATKDVTAFKDAAGTVLYYIVTLQGGGFVVVSGDDAVEPIIAFLKQGTYDSSDSNPLGALVSQDLKARITAAQNAAAAAGRGVGMNGPQSKWATLSEQAKSSAGGRGISSVSDLRVAPLVQTRWSQSDAPGGSGNYCYNTDTPKHYVCGCAATALAQVLRYFQYPTVGVGTTSFPISVDKASSTKALLGGDGSGGPYTWSNMPLAPDASTTADQRSAIGRLCSDAGVALNMDYASSGSGAYPDKWPSKLKSVFKYSNAVLGYNSGSDIGANLNTMIAPSLDAGLPVMLGLRSSTSGHGVVCDGYGYNSGTLYHHLNLGWSGSSDAWYALPNVDTNPGPYNAVFTCAYNIYKSGTGEIISGRALNTAGGVVSGATVTGTGGGRTISATSNAQGIYALVGASSATTYTVTASAAGFGSFTSVNVTTGTSSDNRSDTGNLWGVDVSGNGSSVPAPTVTSVTPTSGPLAGGTSVVIAGTNFTGATSVSFGTVAATGVTVNSATQITCVAPAQTAAGAVSVSVTIPGATGSMASAFTYTVGPPAPTISAVMPGSGPPAGGTTVVITGANFATTGTVAVSFGTTAAASLTVNNSSTITCTAPAHATAVVDVKVTNPDNQSATRDNGYTFRDEIPLTKDVAVNGSTTGGIGKLYYYIDVPAGVTLVRISTTTSATADILDMGVNRPLTGMYPDADIYNADVGSYSYTGNELVIFNQQPVQSGRYYILVQRLNLDAGVGGDYSIVATYVVGGTIPAPTVERCWSANGVYAGGANVWVYGQNFATTGPVTVTFGGVAATDVMVDGSATIVYLTTPAHDLGKVDVTVTNPDNQSGTLAEGYEYVPAYLIPNAVAVPFDTSTGDVPCCFDAPLGAKSVTIATSGTTGDVLDMSANKPSRKTWPRDAFTGDASSATDSGDETVAFTGANTESGRYYILVAAYGDGGAFNITATAEMPHVEGLKRKFSLNFKTYRDGLDITFSDASFIYTDKTAFSAATEGKDIQISIGQTIVDKATLFKGRGTGLMSLGKFQWNAKKGAIKYSLRNASLQDVFAPYGAANAQPASTQVSVPIVMFFDGAYYGDFYSFTYKWVKDKTGQGK